MPSLVMCVVLYIGDIYFLNGTRCTQILGNKLPRGEYEYVEDELLSFFSIRVLARRRRERCS